MEKDNSLICNLCQKSSAKYTCPRCSIQYCSVDCYQNKSHLECSELFYRNCFMESLHSIDADDDEKRRMVEILKNVEKGHSFEDDVNEDDAEVPDLAERISGIDLDKDPEKVLDVLTPEEIEEFQALLKDDKSKVDLVELWNPWWAEKRPTLLEEFADEDKRFPRVPSLLQGIEDVEKLLGTKKPSKTIAFNIVNTLYGYAYVTRRYNGDHLSMSLECAQCLICLSNSLKQAQFSNVATAVGDCISCLSDRDKTLFVSPSYSIAVIDDVMKILRGPNTLSPLLYVMAALSDCHSIFRSAYKSLKNAKKRNPEKNDNVSLFFSVQKKLEFYLSWVKSNGSELRKLIPLLELELCDLSSDLAETEADKKTVEMFLKEQKSKQNRKLIEEL